jgi:hypothetical protein
MTARMARRTIGSGSIMTTYRITFSALALLAMLSPFTTTPALADEANETVEADRGSGRNYVGDANKRWFHIGGGVGAIEPEHTRGVSPVGRFVLGGGGYTFGLYGHSGMELSGTARIPMEIQGVAGFGVHIPIPVVHPMFGVKAGIGAANIGGHGVSPSFMIGGQFGVIVRQFDGRIGIRVMVEPAIHSYPLLDTKAREVYLTLAFVL